MSVVNFGQFSALFSPQVISSAHFLFLSCDFNYVYVITEWSVLLLACFHHFPPLVSIWVISIEFLQVHSLFSSMSSNDEPIKSAVHLCFCGFVCVFKKFLAFPFNTFSWFPFLYWDYLFGIASTFSFRSFKIFITINVWSSTCGSGSHDCFIFTDYVVSCLFGCI